MFSCYAKGGELSLFNVPLDEYCENSHNVKYTKKGFCLVRMHPYYQLKTGIYGPLLGYPANKCMLKVNNRNTRKTCEVCSRLTIKAPEPLVPLWNLLPGYRPGQYR